jgi:hypothetical protein
MTTLHILHTAASNEALLRGMLGHGAAADARHTTEPAWLAACVAAGGVTPEVRLLIAGWLAAAAADGAKFVLTSCSTLGAVFEEEANTLALPAMRIDRPMAEQAIALGPRVLVVACVASTLAPTTALLDALARAADRPLHPRQLLLDALWPRLLAGDRAGYLAGIVAAIRAEPADHDVVVLAQASMADAAAMLADHPVPVLASPRLGVDGLLKRLGRANAAPGS